MTIIVIPTERCNYRCAYPCFEPEKQRHEGTGMVYDFDAIKQNLLQVWGGSYHGSSVCIHGGEPTLIGHEEFEKLCQLIYELPWSEGKVKGSVSLVTNGSLIDDEFIRIMKKWNVYPGVSIDGDMSHNCLRGSNPLTSDATRCTEHERVMTNIKKMRDAGLPVSIMCMIHKYNAGSPENLKALGKWMMKLSKMGITGGRVNPAYGEHELTDHEIYWTWRNVYNWNKKYGWNWNPVVEMEKNLKGEKGNRQVFSPSPCVNNQCDPFNTHTISILPNGFIGNCDRTFSHGFYCRSQSGTKSGRYQALEQTECKDCPYWRVCGGGCPEEGCGGDWRSKTRFCEAIKKMYGFLEDELRKNNPGIELLVDKVKIRESVTVNTAHGDSAHGDSNHGDSNHGDSAHGDANHGDSSHGDAIDWE